MGYGCAGVSELAEVRCERGWVLREDREDGADDVAWEVCGGASRAEREEGWWDVLEPFVQETAEVLGDAA